MSASVLGRNPDHPPLTRAEPAADPAGGAGRLISGRFASFAHHQRFTLDLFFDNAPIANCADLKGAYVVQESIPKTMGPGWFTIRSDPHTPTDTLTHQATIL